MGSMSAKEGMTRARASAPVLLALLTVGAAILPGSAQAGVRADLDMRFTNSAPGASTGISTRIVYKNPEDPEAKPVPVRREVFTFPRGTRFNGSVVPDCTASDRE